MIISPRFRMAFPTAMLALLTLHAQAAAPTRQPVAAKAASAAAPAKYPFKLPPSAQLRYKIKARQSGITLEGDAQVQWSASAGKYAVKNEARAMLVGKILDSQSEGGIDEHGLAPLSFTEKRFRKDATTTVFERDKSVIRFSTTDQTAPLQRGEQDRNSAIWQLASVARATPRRFTPGSEWTFMVAGQRDADPWTFKVVGQEKIRTPLGELNALHLVKQPPPDSKEQQVDLWLGPQHEWYPVRLRYTDTDGDYIEQTLEQVEHKSS